MKTLHLGIIIIFGASLGIVNHEVFADASNVVIQNIQVQPSTIKVGDKFAVTTTLVNNSTFPVVLDSGTCYPNRDITHVPFFTVIFDNHTKIKETNSGACAGVGLLQILNSGTNTTQTSPDYSVTYIATESGTANLTVSFSYHVVNQTDPTQSNLEQKISKSFLFTIYNNTQTIPANLNHSNPTNFSQHLMAPLEQFKSGIAAKDVKCIDGFQLIIKSEDGSPACVKPSSVQKLVDWGWALTRLSVDGLKETYSIGEKINFTINFQGLKHYCDYPHVGISDSNQNVVWKSKDITSMCISTPFSPLPYVNQRFDLNSTYGEPIVINEVGNYTLKVTLYGVSIEKVFTVIANQTSMNQNSNSTGTTQLHASFMDCDTPYNPKSGFQSPLYHNGTRISTGYTPVFYMPMNSTGKLCVHYANWDKPKQVGVRMFEANDLAQDAKSITISDSKTIPTGNSTIVYTINSANKAGFYGMSFFCGGMPFAVGYDNQSRIVPSDFPWLKETFFCPAITFNSDIIGTSGIGIYYITETTREQIGYNITGVSVSSTHPSSTSQNVTFTLNIRTYDAGAKLWFDYKDSNAIKFIGDPLLKEDPNPCAWTFTNDRSVDHAQWLKLVGGFRVTDNPVTIPSYSNGTYTFSIFAKNLDNGWYGMSPMIFSESSNSNIPLETLGGQAIASYYPITMGLDSNLNPSGVCVK